MTPGGFGPRFVPSTAVRRFGFVDDEHTEMMPERLLRDRADTVRIAPPRSHPLTMLISMPPVAKLIFAGALLGSLVAILYAYRPGIG
jgi:hypothetical protein